MQHFQGPSFKSASIKFASLAALTLLSISAGRAENKSLKIAQPVFPVTSALRTTFAATALEQQQPPAAPIQAAAPAQAEQKATNVPATPAGTKATIYVYRLRLNGGRFNKPSIYVDGKEVARIRNGRFFIVNLDPGRHVIRSDEDAVVTLDMNPGQVAYIRVALVATARLPRGATMLVSPEQGWAEIGQAESSDPSDIKDHELAAVGAMPPKPAFVPGAATDLSAPGTGADAQLAADITRMIRAFEAADHPGCKLQVVKQLHSADQPGVELWDVRSCDATSSYNVQIIPSPKGGSDFRVVKSVPGEKKKEQKTTDTAAAPPVSSQAATADASSGELVPYEGQKSEFTIAIPKGWVGRDQSPALGKGNSYFNLILFHPSYPDTAQDQKSAELMAVKLLTGIDSGEIPSFFIQRLPAKNGMSCAGFSEKAAKDVFKMITNDPILDKRATILEAPRSEPAPVAGCKGVRIHGTGQPAKENTPQTLDVYAVSDGKVLYLFTLRNHADAYKKNVEVFQKSVATAKLSAATP